MPTTEPDVDLASRWVGGTTVAASDESFGDKENLLNPGPASVVSGQYGNRGEIVDGWETRRRRAPGHDWVIVRLGTPGVIAEIEVDTTPFTGNHPEQCAVEATGCLGYPSPAELVAPSTEWAEIVPRSALQGGAHNAFAVTDPHRFTHVRLSIFPDGGVARLRVRGRVVVDPREFDGLTLDLASQQYGGAVIASSDAYFTSATMLNRPDRARSMGEGWETRRRRDDGNDHVIVRLALAGIIRRVIADTAYFRYNASAEIELFGTGSDGPPAASAKSWRTLVERTRLQPDSRHVLHVDSDGTPTTFIRLDAYPDGGLSRLRVIGSVTPEARMRAGLAFLDRVPGRDLSSLLTEMGISTTAVERIVAARPLRETWADDLAAAGAERSGGADMRRLRLVIEGPPDRG